MARFPTTIYIFQQYLYDRTRYGFAGSLDYKLNASSDLYAHGHFSNVRDFGQKYAYQLTAGDKAKYKTSIRRPNLQILALGGNQVFNHTFARYQISIAHSRFGGAAGNPGAKFKAKAGTDCEYERGPSEYRPQYTSSRQINMESSVGRMILRKYRLRYLMES
jgi:hypothetical protein